MAEYEVSYPIVGIASTVVEAKSEDEAKSKALDSITMDSIDEWYCVEHVCSGNVCHAPLFDVEVEEV